MSAARVTVVIVNWNGEEFLADCLDSVAAQDFDGGVLPVVIDNGSTDGSLHLLAERYPEVEVIESERNNYAGANNRGVGRAGGEFAMLLNTDARLASDCVRLLVQALEGDARAGAAGPRIVYPDGRLFSTGIHEREDLYWVDRDQGEPDAGAGSVESVFGLSGCCVLFRVAAWQEVGGQDEDFHMYYEDVDLALRLRAADWSSRYVPAAKVVHIGHGSIQKAPKWKDELGERNRLLVLARHYTERFGDELVRSPWFQSAPPDEVRALLPLLAARLGGGEGEALLDLMLCMRDAVRGFAGELDTRYGEHRNLPRILEEREEWIAKLLEEVRRLRIYRLPWKRLKPSEAEFLENVRRRRGPGGGG